MRVLIADDDATSRLVLKSMVSKLDHKCLVAEDGTQAWEMLSAEKFDVLLTDWLMPGIDGPELCRRVRADLSDHFTYIVLITGLADREQVLEGMTAGADDYLVKPVDPFAVQTRLVAAERVTSLHHQMVNFREQLERANIDLLERSLTDGLTGLGNRRRMEEDLARAHSRSVRARRSYGVALFDIDEFKPYNDHYGHLAGDEVLRQVAACFTREMRAGESVYRFGGEEFLLLLDDCDTNSAIAAAERISNAVSNLAIPHEARKAEPPRVTISGGVACWAQGSTSSVPEMLKLADEALFRAKAAGRNRVEASGLLERLQPTSDMSGV